MDNKKTKICKHCQSEIPKKAKVCPNCRKKQGKGILKKIFLIYIVLCFLGLLLNSGSNEEKEAEDAKTEVTSEKTQDIIEEQEEEPVKRKEDKEENKNSKSFEYADMIVYFVEYSIEENAVGEKCLVLYFDFTNDRDESQAFGYTFTVKAFQDGVELEPTYFHVNEETKNSTKEIKPGVTLRVAEQYGIEDVSGTIEVEIEPFNIWSDELLLDYEFSLDE